MSKKQWNKHKNKIIQRFRERLTKLGAELNKDKPHVIGVDLAIYELITILKDENEN